MIAFYVQGGGLGHLSRTHQLIQYLKIDTKEVLIISPSTFKNYFKQYNFITISWNDSPENWSEQIIEQLTAHSIQECFIDAFPLGIKGELVPVYKALAHISFTYTSRILKWNSYLKTIPEAFTPTFTKTIVLEKLYDTHLEWIQKTTEDVVYSSLPTHNLQKQLKLTEDPYALLIHSGGRKDVFNLCKKVKAAVSKPIMNIIVFTQVAIDFEDKRFQFKTGEYPVAQYFKHATEIYSAAGFNLMNELIPYQEKHKVFPLDRLFDDQFFRAKHSDARVLK